jgi:hypothetical protein
MDKIKKEETKKNWEVYQEYRGSDRELLETFETLEECVKFSLKQYKLSLECYDYLPKNLKKVPVINQPKDCGAPFKTKKDFAFFKVAEKNDINYLYKDVDDSEYLLYCVKIGSKYWKKKIEPKQGKNYD